MLGLICSCIASCIVSCLLVVTLFLCTTSNFEVENEKPKIVLALECDTITAGNAYLPQYELFDDNTITESLSKNLFIWAVNRHTAELHTLQKFYKFDGEYYVLFRTHDSKLYSEVESLSVIVLPIIDTTPPVIALKGSNPIHFDLGQKYIEYGAIGIDNIDGDISNKIEINGTDVNELKVGAYKVYYFLSDNSGNKAEKIRSVAIIGDTIPPVIYLLGTNPLLVDIFGPYKDPEAFAIDDVDDTIPYRYFDIESNIDIDNFGKYTTVYKVKDDAGNEQIKIRQMEVVDTIKPVIILNGPHLINLSIGYEYKEYGIKSAIDNYDGDLLPFVESSGYVNILIVSLYTIFYKVTDSHGNECVEWRIVNVESREGRIERLRKGK